MKEKNLGNSLFIPRESDGSINRQMFNAVRELHEALSKYEWFVGVAPHGSRPLGLADDSDLDVFVVFDSTDTPRGEIEKQIEIEEKFVSDKFNIPVDSAAGLIDIRGVENLPAERLQEFTVQNVYAALTHPYVKSSRMQTLRKKLADKMKVVPIDERRDIIDKIAQIISNLENIGKEKYDSRTGNAFSSYTDERLSRWKRKVNEIFNKD